MKDNNITTNSSGTAAERTEAKDQSSTTQSVVTASASDCDSLECHPSTTESIGTASVCTSDSMECQPSTTQSADTASISNADSMECQPSTAQSPSTASVSNSGFQTRMSEYGPAPTLEEVRAAIPEEGIPLRELVELFRLRVKSKANMIAFVVLVKQSGKQDPVTKRIVPRKE